MAVVTNENSFLTVAYKSGLLDESAVSDQYATKAMLPSEPQACAAELVNKGLLTAFQAKTLLSGKYKGFVLGPYRVKDQLGKGGMGVVYLAEHTGLKRLVAVKVLPKECSQDKLALERFFREARSAAALDHPNIVRLHDISEEKGVHYLVMEYVEGMTLEELTGKTGRLHYAQAAEYVAQAAYGLQHAHDKGFVHRDIKPSNLMLTKDGKVKILDMGLARQFENPNDNLTSLLGDGGVAGTADFVSPEQALNDPVDARSDIYSLGATLYALITGKPPFAGNTSQKLLQHHMAEPPRIEKFVPGVPPELCEVVSIMMAKDAEDRYSSATDVIAALSSWLPGGASVSASTTKSMTKTVLRGGTKSRLSVTKSGTKSRLLPAIIPEDPTKRTAWYVGGGIAALVLVGGLIAALSGGSGDKIKYTGPVNIAQGVTEPTKAPALPKLDRGSLALLTFDDVTNKKMTLKDKEGSKAKDGTWLPGSWAASCWKNGMLGTAEVKTTSVGKVMVLTNTTTNSQAYGIEFASFDPLFKLKPGNKARVRLEYRTDPGGKGWLDTRFASTSRDIIQKINLADTRGEWVTVNLDMAATVEMPVHVFVANTAATGYALSIRQIHVIDPAIYREPVPSFNTAGVTFEPISLESAVTACSKDEVFSKGKPLNLDFEEWGTKSYRGVPFKIIDPANQAKNFILLNCSQGSVCPEMPKSVRVPIGRPASTLHILGGVSGWGFPYSETVKTDGNRGTSAGTECVQATIHYADGTKETTSWKNGEHFADYNFGGTKSELTKSIAGSELAFEFKLTRQIRYLSISPKKTTPIKELIFTKSTEDNYTAPMIFAVTAELPLKTFQWGKYEKLPIDSVATGTTRVPLFHTENKISQFVFPQQEIVTPAGVPFELATDKANNVIVLNGSLSDGPAGMAPEKVTIPVNKATKAIHFLGGVGGWAWPWKSNATADDNKGKVAAIVRLIYADGNTETVEWFNGVHIADHNKRNDVSGSDYVCEAGNGQQVRSLTIQPQRQSLIKEIEFSKGELPHCAPVIFAMTLEPIAEVLATTVPTPVPAKPAPQSSTAKTVAISLARAANVDTSKALPGGTAAAMGLMPEAWGKATYVNIEFDLPNPSKGMNAVMLHGSSAGGRPKTAKASVFQQAKKIHILGGVALGGYPVTPEKAPALTIRLHSLTGGVEEITFDNKEHISDYSKREDVPGSVFAAMWKHGRQVRVLTLEPKTKDVIREMEFVAPCVGINPIIMAVTIETP